MAVEIDGIGALLRREGEEPRPVELRLRDEAQQLVVVVLGLARIPDDERRPKRGVGFALPDGRDPFEKTTAVAPPPHAPEQALGDVLQRQVEVRDIGRADGVDQAIVELGRIQVEEPHPRRPLGYRLHERDDRAGRPDVAAVGRQVLGDEHDLLHVEFFHFGEDRLDGARTLLAPKRRDGAEAAVPVTPLGDLDVCPRHGARRPWQVEEVE